MVNVHSAVAKSVLAWGFRLRGGPLPRKLTEQRSPGECWARVPEPRSPRAVLRDVLEGSRPRGPGRPKQRGLLF